MMLYVIDIMSTSIYYSYLGHVGDVNSIRVHVCVWARGSKIRGPLQDALPKKQHDNRVASFCIGITDCWIACVSVDILVSSLVSLDVRCLNVPSMSSCQ